MLGEPVAAFCGSRCGFGSGSWRFRGRANEWRRFAARVCGARLGV